MTAGSELDDRARDQDLDRLRESAAHVIDVARRVVRMSLAAGAHPVARGGGRDLLLQGRHADRARRLLRHGHPAPPDRRHLRSDKAPARSVSPSRGDEPCATDCTIPGMARRPVEYIRNAISVAKQRWSGE